MTYDENMAIAEARLKPELTDEFFSTLALAVRTVGWDIDMGEAVSLYRCLRYIAEKPPHEPPEIAEAIDYNKGSQ